MRSVVNSVVLVALLAAPFAQAQEKILHFRTNEELRAEASQDDGARGVRVSAEILGGGLGAVGGGLAGFLLGSTGRNNVTAGLGTLGGVAVGAWSGTMIGGNLAGGYGDAGMTLLGTLAGSGLSIFLIPALANSNSPVLILGAAVALPLAGAIIGYETSQRPHPPAPPSGYSLRFMPTVSLAADGKGVTTGVAGTF